MNTKFAKILCVLCILTMAFAYISVNPTEVLAAEDTDVELYYRAHTEDYGWEKDFRKASKDVSVLDVSNPTRFDVAGTMGEGKRMEALEINLDAPEGVKLVYRAHVENYGWMDWVTADNNDNHEETAYVGTHGEGLRVEGFEIVTEGLEGYELRYRAHVENYGWMNWVTAGEKTYPGEPSLNEFAGTQKQGLRVEAIEIVLVPVTNAPEQGLTYRARVDTFGWDEEWQKTFNDNARDVIKPEDPTDGYAGKVGQAKKLEELEINYNSAPNVNLKYRAHIENIGWTDWVTADNVKGTAMVGTKGEHLRIEGIQIALEGAEGVLDVKYRAHVENVGWTDWVTAGTDAASMSKTENFAGTEGQGLRIEGIQIYLVGHEHTYDWKVKTPATCTESGWDEGVCTVCGDASGLRRVNPLGHEYAEKVDTPATCEKEGKKSQHCIRCDVQKAGTEEVIQALGHNIKTERLYATCEEDGKIVYTCTNAGCEYRKEVETEDKKTGHKYGEYVYNNDATCTKNGTETRTCEVCGKQESQMKNNTIIPHSYVDNDDAVPATCTENGKTASKSCEYCGDTIEGQTVSPLGHSWETVLNGDVNENTCENTIYGSKRCKLCGEKGEDVVIYGTGHKWNDDKTECTVCHKTVAEIMKWGNGLVMFDVESEEKAQKPTNGMVLPRKGDIIEIKVPTPKAGYKFEGWYNKATNERVNENESVTAYQGTETKTRVGDNGVLRVTAYDTGITFEARYVPAN